jgi:hypothetical protein
MRVRFRNPSRDSYSDREARHYSPQQTRLSAAKEYEVHAVSVYNEIAFVLIVDDIDTPTFKPRVLFDVVDPTIPADWICNIFPTGPVQLVMGPPFVAKDLRSYDAMVDQESAEVRALWQRISAQKTAEAARCPVCGLDQGEPPWGEHGDDPTFCTCDCCGLEFNFEAMTPERARELRQHWLASGAKWLRPEAMPANWEREAQLLQVPREFR